MQLLFGAGNMYVTQLQDSFGNTPANPTPFPLAVLQEGSVDFAGEVKELFGQNQLPVGVARTKVKVMLKLKPARVFASAWNLLFFGQTMGVGYIANSTDTVGQQVPATLGVTAATMAGGTGYVVGDTITVVGGTKTVTATVMVTAVTGGNATALQVTLSGNYSVAPTAAVGTNGANVFTGATGVGATGTLTITTTANTFIASPPFTGTAAVPGFGTYVGDLGVLYAASGLPLTRVASAPAQGQYTVNVNTGAYTFAAADANTLLYNNFQYSISAAGTGQKQVVQNLLMGATPYFRVDLTVAYLGKLCNFQFYRCVASKMNLGFKNEDFAVPEFDCQAFDNGAGNVLGWSTME